MPGSRAVLSTPFYTVVFRAKIPTFNLKLDLQKNINVGKLTYVCYKWSLSKNFDAPS